jgi:hypothetical protein
LLSTSAMPHAYLPSRMTPTDWKGVMTFGEAPRNSRGGLMLSLEGNRWMATLGGRHGDEPPGDTE